MRTPIDYGPHRVSNGIRFFFKYDNIICFSILPEPKKMFQPYHITWSYTLNSIYSNTYIDRICFDGSKISTIIFFCLSRQEINFCRSSSQNYFKIHYKHEFVCQNLDKRESNYQITAVIFDMNNELIVETICL